MEEDNRSKDELLAEKDELLAEKEAEALQIPQLKYLLDQVTVSLVRERKREKERGRERRRKKGSRLGKG